MSTDIAQMKLREPEQTDWVNYNAGSKYQAPPAVVNDRGENVVFQGIVGGVEAKANQFAVDSEGNPFLNFQIDPITLPDGTIVRFTEASVKPFEKNGSPVKGNPSKLGNFLKATGTQAKPQSNSEWIAAVNATKGRKVYFVGDWEARNSSTGEKVKGYSCFPDDPERPGLKKSILKAGDIVTERDYKGNVTGTKTIESEVLFANLKVRYFVDPTRQKS